eukprot:c8002_g2_i1 orf=400-555(-)
MLRQLKCSHQISNDDCLVRSFSLEVKLSRKLQCAGKSCFTDRFISLKSMVC